MKNIILALACTFCVNSLSAANEQQWNDQTEVIVNNDVLLTSEIDLRVSDLKKQYQGFQDTAKLREAAIEQLVVKSIQLQMAKRGGLSISDAQLNESMNRWAASLNLDLNGLKNKIESEGQNYAAVRKSAREDLTVEQLQIQLIRSRINVSDSEIARAIEIQQNNTQQQSQYLLQHIRFEQSDLSKAKEVIAQLEKGKNLASIKGSKSLGWRDIEKVPSMFVSETQKLKKGEHSNIITQGSSLHIIELADKSGKNSNVVTQFNTRHILVKTNELVDEITAEKIAKQLHSQVLAGEDFETLARKHSDDVGSKQLGGDLGWTDGSGMVPEFAQQIISTNVGQTSDVFKTPYGYHFLQILDKREQDIGEETLRQQVANEIFQRKFSEERGRWLQEVRVNAYVEVIER